MANYSLGIYGLGIMGSNFLFNVAKKEKVFGYARNEKQIEKIKKLGREKLVEKNLFLFNSVEEFLKAFGEKRKIICLLIPQNQVINVLNLFKNSYSQFLKPDDVIIDCGNTYYVDTIENMKILNGICITTTMGMSGGAKGALAGPAMMIGGDEELKKIFSNFSFAVQTFNPPHLADFVKMVHNGIEYGIMSILAELTNYLLQKWSVENVEHFFKSYNCEKSNFLIDCLQKVLRKKNETGYLFEQIENIAGQKGTGKWCVIEALKLDCAVPIISSAVNQRILTSYKKDSTFKFTDDKITHSSIDESIGKILDIAILLSYFEGLKIIKGKFNSENIIFNLDDLKNAWKKNCIIESKTFTDLKFTDDPIDFLKLNISDFSSEKTAVVKNIKYFTECPTLICALNYLNRNNIGIFIQSIRDVFGQHGITIKGEERNIDWDSSS